MVKVCYYNKLTLALSMCYFQGLGTTVVTQWLKNDFDACLNNFSSIARHDVHLNVQNIVCVHLYSSEIFCSYLNKQVLWFINVQDNTCGCDSFIWNPALRRFASFCCIFRQEIGQRVLPSIAAHSVFICFHFINKLIPSIGSMLARQNLLT